MADFGQIYVILTSQFLIFMQNTTDQLYLSGKNHRYRRSRLLTQNLKIQDGGSTGQNNGEVEGKTMFFAFCVVLKLPIAFNHPFLERTNWSGSFDLNICYKFVFYRIEFLIL